MGKKSVKEVQKPMKKAYKDTKADRPCHTLTHIHRIETAKIEWQSNFVSYSAKTFCAFHFCAPFLSLPHFLSLSLSVDAVVLQKKRRAFSGYCGKFTNHHFIFSLNWEHNSMCTIECFGLFKKTIWPCVCVCIVICESFLLDAIMLYLSLSLLLPHKYIFYIYIFIYHHGTATDILFEKFNHNPAFLCAVSLFSASIFFFYHDSVVFSWITSARHKQKPPDSNRIAKYIHIQHTHKFTRLANVHFIYLPGCILRHVYILRLQTFVLFLNCFHGKCQYK